MNQISPELRSSTVDPAAPWRVHAARVTELRPEVAHVTTYALRLIDDQTAARYQFRPGQFNMLYLPGVGEAAISISSDPDQPERLLHTIRAVGNVTQALARETVGGQVLLRGPFGSAWPLAQCFGDDLLLAAGGLGLAPLRPALHWIANRRHQFRRVCLVYGARTPRDLLYRWQFAEWRNAQIEVHTTVDLGDNDWCGAIGVVPTLLPALRLDPQRTWVMTCGPEVMMRFVIVESLKLGIPAARIHLSIERNMSCALGFCGHCQLGPAFVCRNGPVFSYPQMEPYLHVEDL